MYTDEDKVFCVKRMWAEGLTPTAASRLWGAPSRRTLAAWEKEALGGGLAVEAPRVPGACRRAKHARYPEETRAEALRLLGLGKWIGYIFLDDFGRTKPAFLNSTGVMYPSVECILKLLYQCT